MSTQLRSDSTFLETSHALGLFTIRWFYSQFCCFPLYIIQVHQTVNTCGSKVKKERGGENKHKQTNKTLLTAKQEVRLIEIPYSELSEKEISQITG